MSSLGPAVDLRGRGGRTRRRRLMSRLAEGLALLAALVAVAVLAIVVLSVAKRGASQLSFDFLTQDLPVFGQAGGGIAPLIVGSAILVGIAALIAVPVGVLIAIFTDEFASPKLRGGIQLVIDLMNGLPSIVIAIFVFGLLVYGHQQNGLAGSYGLAIVMLPLVTRATQEVLRLVPSSQREGALALGASRWRTVLGIVLPSAMGGIITGQCSPSRAPSVKPRRCCSSRRSTQPRSSGTRGTPCRTCRCRSSSGPSHPIHSITSGPGRPRLC